MKDTIPWLIGSVIQWVCALLVGLPILVFAARRKAVDVQVRKGINLAFFFLVSLSLARLDLKSFPLPGPWTNMVIQAVWALVVIYGTRSASKAGLTMDILKRSWRDCMVITGIFILFVILRRIAIRLAGIGEVKASNAALEFLLYQMLMPGLAEELVYRSVIQSSLNEVFAHSWQLGGARIGWGWIIASVVFWAPHAFRVDAQLELSFYWPTLTMQLFAGFLYGWVFERSKSVFPAILSHNLVNVVWTLV